MSGLTFEEEKKRVEEMMAIQLIPEINKLLRMKKFQAKLTGASTDQDFLYINLLVDVDNTPDIVKVEMILEKNTLYSRSLCQEVDKGGKYIDRKDDFTLPQLVKLRVLRLVFSAVKNIEAGAIDYKNKKIDIAFGDKNGALWYR